MGGIVPIPPDYAACYDYAINYYYQQSGGGGGAAIFQIIRPVNATPISVGADLAKVSAHTYLRNLLPSRVGWLQPSQLPRRTYPPPLTSGPA